MHKRLLAGMLALILTFTSVSIPEDVYAAQNGEDVLTEAAENSGSLSDESEILENALTVEGTNSVGNLLASELSQEITEQEENNGCNVFSIEVIDTSAVVSFETVEDATLVVGIYDEAGVKMVAAGSLEVYSGETTAVVDIETESMPEYFYLRGFLVETDTLRPLCTSYESPMYTQEMQEFLAKTTADFDSEKVLNLDDDTTNNFAVYSDETIIVPEAEGSNEVVTADETTNTYVIENPDESITSLQAGDIFAYEYEEGNVLIVKVASITVDGTTATITGEDTSMEEVFQYVKIDGEAGLSEATIDPSSCDEGVTYEGLVDYTDTGDIQTYGVEVDATAEKAFKARLEKKIGTDERNVTISGGLQMKVDCSVKLYLSFTQKYIEVKLNYTAIIDVSVDGKADGDVPLVTLGFMYSGVIVEVTPSFVLETSGSIAANGTLKGTIGFCAATTGMKNLTTTPKFETEFKAEGKIFVGVSLEPRIKILSDKIASANMTAKVGTEVSAVMEVFEDDSDQKKIHSCKACLDGDINAKVSVSASVKLMNHKDLTFNLKLIDKLWKAYDFYYSADYDEFAFTTCPHLTYRVWVTVIDDSGCPISGATVMNEYTTDNQGIAKFYLAEGNYRIAVTKTGYRRDAKNIKVAGDSVNVVIRLSKTENMVTGANGEFTITKRLVFENVKETWNDGGAYVALTLDNGLYTWGPNFYGELGNGTTEFSSVPAKVMDGVATVSMKDWTVGAITESGELYMWGYNRFGQLGNGTTENSNVPVKILDDVSKVSIGIYATGAITKNGDLYMWGTSHILGDGSFLKDSYVPVKVLENVSEICVGYWEVAAITTDGSLYMWGGNDAGSLGNGTTEDSNVPVKVMDGVVSVSVGSGTVGAITTDGSLYMWGGNNYGQLGNGTTEDSNVPIKVMENVTFVDTDSGITSAITKNGSLYMWGEMIMDS